MTSRVEVLFVINNYFKNIVLISYRFFIYEGWGGLFDIGTTLSRFLYGKYPFVRFDKKFKS